MGQEVTVARENIVAVEARWDLTSARNMATLHLRGGTLFELYDAYDDVVERVYRVEGEKPNER
jgi:hypothetical protein